MVKFDALEEILRICIWLGYSTAYYDKIKNQYRSMKKYSVFVLGNATLITVLIGVYTWQSLNIPTAGYGKIFTGLLVVDSELSFFWCYSMILNGVQQNKNILKLLNLIRRVRQNEHETFRYRIRLFIILNIVMNLFLTYGISLLRLNLSEDVYLVGFNLMFCILSTMNDMYLILFNTLVVRIRTELIVASDFIVQSIHQKRDFRLHAQHYFRVLKLPQLLTESFGMPVLFCIALNFFEGTIQTIHMYQLLDSSLGHSSAGEILAELVNYAIWYFPSLVKLVVTMQLVTSATQKVGLSFWRGMD